ncbi:MAG: D-alanyl-D-alanine carboxypeptidase family protein [Dehalococcoidia bacterium]|nr:D-alanyl-D-alanine carboxypeptidase family protein [Dehalococcoidia bacterium]
MSRRVGLGAAVAAALWAGCTASPVAVSPTSEPAAPPTQAAPTAMPTVLPLGTVPAITITPVFPPPGSTPEPTATPAATPVVHVVNGNDLLAPVNKRNSLPANFAPGDLSDVPVTMAVRAGIRLRRAALEAVQAMVAEAQAQGLQPVVISGFRPYQEQEVLYRGYVARMGEERASRISAVPGHSEHQMGTTIDFSSPSAGYQLEVAFEATREGRWLLQNAVRFGFVLSYPRGKETVTGYAYEPWHYRYLGIETASAVNASGLTLTEYLNQR